jgi:hypothetical protein
MLGVSHDMTPRQELPLFECIEAEGSSAMHSRTSRDGGSFRFSPRLDREHIANIGQPPTRTFAILRIESGATAPIERNMHVATVAFIGYGSDCVHVNASQDHIINVTGHRLS